VKSLTWMAGGGGTDVRPKLHQALRFLQTRPCHHTPRAGFIPSVDRQGLCFLPCRRPYRGLQPLQLEALESKHRDDRRGRRPARIPKASLFLNEAHLVTGCDEKPGRV